ncbi:MAG: 30S ribosomal protein S8 [Deltaproteobacteria bacterium]|nr:30S ribosomal protein S8 [Deltaproteobacteria bacterium]
MMSDPIADMLTRIRNAGQAKHDRTSMPLSKLKVQLAKILKAEGYIADYRIEEEAFGSLVLFLRYGRNHESAIVGLKRASRPGRRLYVGASKIPRVHNGLGVAILSTSKGVMTDRSAREACVGGEILCEVW